jgi:hypothetical protein
MIAIATASLDRKTLTPQSLMRCASYATAGGLAQLAERRHETRLSAWALEMSTSEVIATRTMRIR